LRLSGGEKQRVAIARALLKVPKITIFDEATSSLDSQTEHDIQKSLLKLSKGRSCLIIAHRLSTIVDCDRIVVIKKGKIVEQGKHDQLLTIPNGEYKSMWDRQQETERLSNTLKAISQDEEKGEMKDGGGIEIVIDGGGGHKHSHGHGGGSKGSSHGHGGGF